MYVTYLDAYIQGFQLFVKNLRGKTLVLDGCPGDTIDRLMTYQPYMTSVYMSWPALAYQARPPQRPQATTASPQSTSRPWTRPAGGSCCTAATEISP